MKKINLQDLVGLINEQKEVMNEQDPTKVLRAPKKVSAEDPTKISSDPPPVPPTLSMDDKDKQNAQTLYSVFQKFAPEGKVGQFFQEFKKLYGLDFQPPKVSPDRAPALAFIRAFNDLRLQGGKEEDPRLEQLYARFRDIFSEDAPTALAEEQKKEGK